MHFTCMWVSRNIILVGGLHEWETLERVNSHLKSHSINVK